LPILEVKQLSAGYLYRIWKLQTPYCQAIFQLYLGCHHYSGGNRSTTNIHRQAESHWQPRLTTLLFCVYHSSLRV